MKKFAVFITLFFAGFALAGCGEDYEKTEYDDKEVLRIETVYIPGALESSVNFTRIFDFEIGSVMDEYVASYTVLENMLKEYTDNPEAFPDFETPEDYDAYLNSYYNNLEEVATFTEAQKKVFVRDAMKNGVYTWGDRYADVTVAGQMQIWRITVYFADGTQKITSFFNLDPRASSAKNYSEINSFFEDYLGANIFIEFEVSEPDQADN